MRSIPFNLSAGSHSPWCFDELDPKRPRAQEKYAPPAQPGHEELPDVVPELVAVPDLWSETSPLARLEDDLLVGGLPAVAAGPGDAPSIPVGESLLLEPP